MCGGVYHAARSGELLCPGETGGGAEGGAENKGRSQVLAFGGLLQRQGEALLGSGCRAAVPFPGCVSLRLSCPREAPVGTGVKLSSSAGCH